MPNFEEGLGFPVPDVYASRRVTSNSIEFDVNGDVVLPANYGYRNTAVPERFQHDMGAMVADHAVEVVVHEVHSWADVRPEQ